MKLVLTILVAALAAFAGRKAAAPGTRSVSQRANDDGAARAELAELRAENQRLAAELEQRESRLVAATAPATETGEAEIAAAVARWHAAHPAEERSAAVAERAPARSAASGEPDLASVPMTEIVRALSDVGFGSAEKQELFQRLRELGRIDEYVAAMEALAAADPENADLQVALGHAYLQKLFGMGNTPEVGPVAMKSDAAFDRALEIDDTNWGARFSKAVSLTNWPAFLGRGPEAIEHFEILLEQQATRPKQPQFAMTYLFLGNMLQAGGKREQALATWRAGLEQFPDEEQLRSAIELATASDDDRPKR